MDERIIERLSDNEVIHDDNGDSSLIQRAKDLLNYADNRAAEMILDDALNYVSLMEAGQDFPYYDYELQIWKTYKF